MIMLFCPVMVFWFYISISKFQGSLLAPFQFLFLEENEKLSIFSLFSKARTLLPSLSLKVFFWVFAWILFQASLYQYLPGPVGIGQTTPAGYLLKYKVNGLRCWCLTHLLYILFTLCVPWFSGSVIADHFGEILIAANIYGYSLAFLAYFKAYYFPTHPEDRKFSESKIYDFFMGIEFNPRWGQLFDFKLFHNGRPGIIAWTLISLSFTIQQYQTLGYISNGLVLVNILYAIYVIDFFYNEDWYLRTIDICHDHFGFYLAWGDSVWLPFMYTLQSHYLAVHPQDWSTLRFFSVLSLGLIGYIIFRGANHQKNIVRKSNGKCKVWGKASKFLRLKYTTIDGEKHESILLISGYWGLARHMNYFGDLCLSLSMCMACGLDHILPFFYFFYMFILLTHRIYRDDARCRGKYGVGWDKYCQLVPYKLIPYVW
ncbi:hypothetical protein HMI56_002511 [Coelomomyces lativittatus]|nr:hypothetical protein HMI56_002511 [Coelomomyces lativittatus]